MTLSTIIFSESYCQIAFENGYFINESNEKINCLIKNLDWKNNPTEFEYQLSQSDIVQKATIQTVKEFGIDNTSKYIRAKVNIDRSSNQIDKIGPERNPEFQEELLFLKVIIEGKASLLMYTDTDLTRFFYRLGDSEIEQLVYKKYLIDNTISENNSYKQEIFLKLKCESIGLEEIENLEYSTRYLQKLFIKYNECAGLDYINFKPQKKQDFFNLTFRPGINFSSLEIQVASPGSLDAEFGNQIGYRFGVEAEFILPYNKNKWAMIIEPTYQQFKVQNSRETINIPGGVLVAKVNYKSIEIPVGVRHYFYLNEKSKLFANISYVFDFSINSSITFMRNDDIKLSELETKSRGNAALGIGYKFKDRFSLETRYFTSRNILGDYYYWNSDYRTFSIIIGYSIF